MLDRTAEILRDEMKIWKTRQIMGEHVRRWEEAIGVLEWPRGAIDNPHDWLLGGRAKTGDSVRAWTYMAVEIVALTLQVLRGYRIATSLGRGAAMIKFTVDILRFIGVNDLPSEGQISRVLTKHLRGGG